MLLGVNGVSFARCAPLLVFVFRVSYQILLCTSSKKKTHAEVVKWGRKGHSRNVEDSLLASRPATSSCVLISTASSVLLHKAH